MPARSQAQQMAAGAALAAGRREQKTKLKDASRSLEKSMTEAQLQALAGGAAGTPGK